MRLAAGEVRTRGVLDDRREVDVFDVVLPVDDARVEAERLLVLASLSYSNSSQRAVDAKARLGLGVGAVQLHVLEGPLRLRSRRSSIRAANSARSPRTGSMLTSRSAAFRHCRRPAELALHLAPARERPLRHDDWLASVVVEGPLR